MKKIEAIIRPWELEALQKGLSSPWIQGITVSEVKGVGRALGHVEVYRGSKRVVDVVPRIKVEIVVPEPLVPGLLHELEHLLRTGRPGDGKLFVTPIVEAVRIRTGDRGEDAL